MCGERAHLLPAPCSWYRVDSRRGGHCHVHRPAARQRAAPRWSQGRGKHVAFDGLDEPSGKVPDFIRSIPIEKAMHPDTLLATIMNGAPLTPEHGFPLRAMVPGWLGAAS